MGVDTFHSKFALVVVYQGNEAPIQPSFVPEMGMRLAQLPTVWGILGQDKRSCFGEFPLVQCYHKE